MVVMTCEFPDWLWVLSHLSKTLLRITRKQSCISVIHKPHLMATWVLRVRTSFAKQYTATLPRHRRTNNRTASIQQAALAKVCLRSQQASRGNTSAASLSPLTCGYSDSANTATTTHANFAILPTSLNCTNTNKLLVALKN